MKNEIFLQGRLNGIADDGHKTRFILQVDIDGRRDHHECWFYHEWMGKKAQDLENLEKEHGWQNLTFRGNLRYRPYDDDQGITRVIAEIFVRSIDIIHS